MATVNTQTNPIVAMAGTKDGDCTIITSGWASTTHRTIYEIVKVSTNDTYTVDTRHAAILTNGNVRTLDASQLRIILESRTAYRVRARNAHEAHTPLGDWSDWVSFTTRDKRYQSPHAITQLTDDSGRTAGSAEHCSGRVINITNNGKATVTNTTTGATVVNTDTVYVEGQLQRRAGESQANPPHHPVVDTATGATVINVPSGGRRSIVYTANGATVAAS